MIFENVKTFTIPEGTVRRITSGGIILWEEDYRDVYQRLDYIVSDGNQYFITDFIADNESGMELTAELEFIYHTQVPMGSCINTNTGLFYIIHPMSETSCYYGFNTGNTVDYSANDHQKYRFQTNFCNNRKIGMYIDGLSVIPSIMSNISSTLPQQTVPIGILACTKGDGSVATPRALTFYNAKISQGSEVVREYIPCYRKSDNIVGLYEIYTGEFLINLGSGEFEIGNEIDW